MRRTRRSGSTAGEALPLQLHIAGPQKGVGSLSCVVLASPDHPGLCDRWVPYADRQPPPRPSKNDWLYPMFWWRGAVGVNEDAARAVFGARLR